MESYIDCKNCISSLVTSWSLQLQRFRILWTIHTQGSWGHATIQGSFTDSRSSSTFMVNARTQPYHKTVVFWYTAYLLCSYKGDFLLSNVYGRHLAPALVIKRVPWTVSKRETELGEVYRTFSTRVFPFLADCKLLAYWKPRFILTLCPKSTVLLSFVLSLVLLLCLTRVYSATVGFLGGPTVAAPARVSATISAFASLGSLIVGVFSIWRHQSNASTVDSVRLCFSCCLWLLCINLLLSQFTYMYNVQHSYLGLHGHAVLLSLPPVLLVWAIVAFAVSLVAYTVQGLIGTASNLHRGSAWTVLGVLVILLVAVTGALYTLSIIWKIQRKTWRFKQYFTRLVRWKNDTDVSSVWLGDTYRLCIIYISYIMILLVGLSLWSILWSNDLQCDRPLPSSL